MDKNEITFLKPFEYIKMCRNEKKNIFAEMQEYDECGYLRDDDENTVSHITMMISDPILVYDPTANTTADYYGYSIGFIKKEIVQQGSSTRVNRLILDMADNVVDLIIAEDNGLMIAPFTHKAA